jgi:AcrR family transcriptional regulator
MRADAKRNYDRLVEAAREVFREQGYDASLDEVAKRAGVGPGTLYRHFPKRENLLDAIMQSWVQRVDEAVEKTLAFEGPPRDLLLGWFQEYVQLISLHKGGPAKITSAMGDPESPIHHKCQVLRGAHDQVIAALRERDALRAEPVEHPVSGRLQHLALGADRGALVVERRGDLGRAALVQADQRDVLLEPVEEHVAGRSLLQERLVRGLVHPVDPALHDRVDEVLALREVAVERARADPGPFGDLVERGVVALLAEDHARDLEDAVVVALRVGTHGLLPSPEIEKTQKQGC